MKPAAVSRTICQDVARVEARERVRPPRLELGPGRARLHERPLGSLHPHAQIVRGLEAPADLPTAVVFGLEVALGDRLAFEPATQRLATGGFITFTSPRRTARGPAREKCLFPCLTTRNQVTSALTAVRFIPAVLPRQGIRVR